MIPSATSVRAIPVASASRPERDPSRAGGRARATPEIGAATTTTVAAPKQRTFRAAVRCCGPAGSKVATMSAATPEGTPIPTTTPIGLITNAVHADLADLADRCSMGSPKLTSLLAVCAAIADRARSPGQGERPGPSLGTGHGHRPPDR